MMDRLTIFWTTAKRPYTKVDAWLMAHKPELWAEMYHLGLVFAALITIVAVLSGLLFWQNTLNLDYTSSLWHPLTAGLLLYWIWGRSRLYSCLPFMPTVRGWWFGVLDLIVCAAIALAPVSHRISCVIMVRMNQKNVEAEIVEGERLMLAVGLWKGIASYHLCDNNALNQKINELSDNGTREELIGPNVFGYRRNLNFSQPPGVPKDFDPSKVSVLDTPTDRAGKLSAPIDSEWWRLEGAAIEQYYASWPVSETKIQVENYLFDITHWLHAKSAFQFLGIHGVEMPKDALKLATLQALTEIIQPVLDKHQGPKLPTELLDVSDTQHQSMNIPLVAKTCFAPEWMFIHGYYKTRVDALGLQLFDRNTINHVFLVIAVLFLILITTLSLPAVGVGRYWMGAGASLCINFLFGLQDSLFYILLLTPLLLLVPVLLNAFFQVLHKSQLILICASMLAMQPLGIYFLSYKMELNMNLDTYSGPIVILAALLLLNALARILFTRLRSMPDAN